MPRRIAAAVLAGLLLPGVAGAQDLWGSGGNSLRADTYRNPGEARWQAGRALRRLGGATSTEALRQEWALKEIERDAARTQRMSRPSRLARADGRSGLAAPAELLPPYPVDLSGRDVLLGTAKLFIRVGRLLDEADALAATGPGARSLPMVEAAARALAEAAATPGVPVDDPNLVALSARVAAARARTGEAGPDLKP